MRARLAHAEAAVAPLSVSYVSAPTGCEPVVWGQLQLRLVQLHAALLERARFGACGWQAAADTSAPRDASSRLLSLPRADGDVACCLWSDQALGRALAAAAHAVDAQPRPSDEPGAGAPAASLLGRDALEAKASPTPSRSPPYPYP